MKNYQLLSHKYCPFANFLMSLNPSFIFSIPLSRHTSFWSTYSDLPSWWLNLSCCSVAQLCPTLCDPMDYSTPGLPPCPSPSPRVCPSSCSLHWWCHPAITFWHPFLLLPSIFPSIRDFSNESYVRIRSVCPVNIQGSFPLRLAGLISLLSKGFQESSLAPQFKGISSLVFCLLYGPALMTVHDQWEDHSLTIRNSVSKLKSLLFIYHCLGLSLLSCQEAIVFWFHGCSHHL